MALLTGPVHAIRWEAYETGANPLELRVWYLSVATPIFERVTLEETSQQVVISLIGGLPAAHRLQLRPRQLAVALRAPLEQRVVRDGSDGNPRPRLDRNDVPGSLAALDPESVRVITNHIAWHPND